jgi:hypothetical protein
MYACSWLLCEDGGDVVAGVDREDVLCVERGGNGDAVRGLGWEAKVGCRVKRFLRQSRVIHNQRSASPRCPVRAGGDGRKVGHAIAVCHCTRRRCVECAWRMAMMQPVRLM